MTRLRYFAAAVLLGGLLQALPATAAPTAAVHDVAVIVQAPGAEAAAAAAVREHGGRVTAALPIVSGFAATMPSDAVDELRATPGVRAVTPDATMTPTARPGGGGGGGSKPASLPKSVYRTEIGSDVLATSGATGDGIRVAVVDTGVDTAVATDGDLAGKVVPVQDPYFVPETETLAGPTTLETTPPDVLCANFSGEATCDDTFGHGTFMAGLIAGSGAASAGRYTGVAPDAEIVSVKVGGADGSADVSKVLAGIQWVVSFSDLYNIRVMNLSLGTDSTVPPELDPLNHAVQRAWVEGITVVVSAGNFGQPATGATYGTVTKPGDDPFVLTVGSVDDLETTKITDDRLPGFSSWGPTAAGAVKPDVVAPGARLVSLRAPGSFIDTMPGIVNTTYRRGSGTSMSAAVVSGLAAQLLEAEPTWRPDDVKDALMTSARDAASTNVNAVGAGLVHGPSALAATISPTYRTIPISTGLGSLDGSRGTNIVEVTTCECLLTGDETAQGNNWHLLVDPEGNNWHAASFTSLATQWSPETWYVSQWVVTTGNNWHGNNWHATTWAEGNNWHGGSWQGSTYYTSKPDKRGYGATTAGSGSYGAWGS